MASMALHFFFLSFLSYMSIVCAQGRSPHGLAYENPMVLSPSAVDFFHPKSSSSPSSSNDYNSPSPLPLSSFSSSTAVAQSTLAHESKFSTSNTSGNRVGVGAVIGIVFGFVMAVLVAMGVYYVVVTRQTNATRANSIQPDHV